VTSDHIAQLALTALRASDAAKQARREFSDAVRACVDYKASDEDRTAWKFHRLTGSDPVSGTWHVKWVDALGNDASDAPEVVRNKQAWQALRDARKAAGIAKANLTRALRRWEKDGTP
jgi:hypothetical protein